MINRVANFMYSINSLFLHVWRSADIPRASFDYSGPLGIGGCPLSVGKELRIEINTLWTNVNKRGMDVCL